MSANRHAMPTEWIDPDDAPELTDEFFERADEHVGGEPVRLGRPKVETPKLALTVRHDADVVQAFKAAGKGWQTRMKAAPRDWLSTHQNSRETSPFRGRR